MKSAFTIILAVVLFIQKGIGNPVETCCKAKTVGNIAYSLIGEGLFPARSSCLNGCIYRRDSDPASGQKFCFASGELLVECVPTGEPGVWTTAAPPGPTGFTASTPTDTTTDAPTTPPTATTTTSRSADVLLVLGGDGGLKSAEVWSPDGVTCSLPPLPEDMNTATVDLAGGNITACYDRKCWLLGQSAWEEGPATHQRRRGHTSVVLPGGAILLVGGLDSPTTTEIIRPNSPSVAGFRITPGRVGHCSVQTGPTLIVLTGGFSKWSESTLVTEHSGIDQGDLATSKDLPSLNQGRHYHACGMYTVGDSKVIIVAGGYSSDSLDTTETLELSSTGAGWILRTGKMPSHRYGLRGATLDNIFYVSGGNDGNYLNSILAWTDATEEWTQAGTLVTSRHNHGGASVPSSAVQEWCG